MISVTGFDGMEFYINCDLIETIKETPDTVITISTGKKLIVKESAGEIVDKIVEYRKMILNGINIERVIRD